MRVVLNVTEGPGAGRQFAFERHDVFLVGRSQRCHFSVGEDLDCSRVHLVMVVSPPVCRLRDLGSTNHTFVNGARVEETVLRHGDVIRAGQTVIRVQIEGAEREQEGERRDPAAPGTRQAPEAVENGSLAPVHLEGAAAPPEPAEEGEEEGGPPLRFAEDDDADQEGGGLVFQEDDDLSQLSGDPSPPAPEGSESESTPRQSGLRSDTPDDGPIPGYRLVRQLGVGGMGQVWLAEDTRNGRQVAIKTMIPDIAASRRMVRRFERESRISLNLQHANIVEFIDAGEHQGQLYIVMEYVEGTDAEHLREQQGGRLVAREVVAMGLQTLDALRHAHGRGVIHRDLKPPNLLLKGRAPNWQVKLTDFGLARNYSEAGASRITRLGDVLGSFPYMPPEHVQNLRNADQRADLFSLGATMYHLLTGQFIYDFHPSQRDPMITVLEDTVIPMERRGVSVSRTISQVIHRALEKDRERRYRTAEEMREALAGAGW